MIFGKEIDKLLIDFYKENKGTLLGSLFCSVFTFTIESLILPKIMAKLVAKIDDKDELKNNIMKLLGTWAVVQVSYSLSEMVNSKIEPLLTKFITDKIINSIFIKYENTHMEINTSIIFTKIILLRTTIDALVDRIYIVLIPRIISIILIVINFFMINKKLGMMTFILILLQFLVIIKNMRKCIKMSFEEVESNEDVIDEIGDKFENIHMISAAMDGIEREMKECKQKSDDMLEQRFKSNECIIKSHVDGYISNSIVFCVTMLYSQNLYKNNEITEEDMTTILLTIGSFFNNMYEITYYIPEITKKIGILESNHKFIEELFNYELDHGTDVEIKEGIITFSNVSYSYDSDTYNPLVEHKKKDKVEDDNKSKKTNIIIKNFSKTLKPNTIIAIFGPSGSGKTTFIKLILNILRPQTASITIDGYDVNELSSKTLKKYISYVSQSKITLFEKTILQNITYGYEDELNIEDRIKDLINKYDLIEIFGNVNKNMELMTGEYDRFGFLNYNVGKYGNLLSGGQRQIIHIIRSILNKTSKIIILDEPTTALDNMNRDNVIKMLKDNCKMKTVLIITHDETIKKLCDSVITF